MAVVSVLKDESAVVLGCLLCGTGSDAVPILEAFAAR
jgi:hypothetical protein